MDDPGPDVELLGGDAQGAGQLLEHFGGGLAQTALDLAQVGIADADLVGELPQGELDAEALLLEEVAQRPNEPSDPATVLLVTDFAVRASLSLAMSPLC